ncbi:TonB family protein [Spirosoma sp. KNUC1025]|uniref:M56 family metallopeptidase n=1 Tax=Spirosoma sp. KNUC1025 TaxID=2894082 RepID=UPI003866F2AD|nr:TonB family protein [Spirosoma sp. KNUC1025]
MNALDYFLKANLYGLLFVGCYWLLLRHHTFFRLNRLYLLVSAMLSLVLPLVNLPTQTVETLPRLDWPVPIPVGVITLPAATAAISPAEPIPAVTFPDWEQVGLIAYGIIALGLILRFMVHTIRLLQLIRRSPRHTNEGYVLVQPNNPTIPTFSFFHYVILNPADAHNALIMQHELVHVRQYHSADVVTLSLLRAVFWACPTLWLMDRLLRQVHEFLADKPTHQPTEYARFLVDYSFGLQSGLSGPDTLTNRFFNPSLLKQRIIMLHRKATTRWALGKYALVLPLAFSLLAMTTAREEIAAIVDQSTGETLTVSGRVTSLDGKPLPGANVVIANTGKGTHTDAQGNYKLVNVPGKAQISISFVGFTTKVLPVSGRTTLNAALTATDPAELPTMGATSVYKAIKPNPNMPVRTPPSSETINGKVYTAVEEPAVFPTGVPGLMQYVAHELRYPAKAKAARLEGVVLVQFVVMPNGSVGAATIKKGFDTKCNVEALRVVKKMPPWLPGKQNGKAVATQYVIPIQFALEKKEDKRTGKIDPETFSPTGSPIGEFPAVRDANYPNQPRLAMTTVSADAFKADTVPAPGLMRKPNTPVTIRANGPLGPLGNDPLYVIDGVEIPKDTPKPISGLSPNDIKDVHVLKGEAATSTYGEKGKDGVIIITTKKK